MAYDGFCHDCTHRASPYQNALARLDWLLRMPKDSFKPGQDRQASFKNALVKLNWPSSFVEDTVKDMRTPAPTRQCKAHFQKKLTQNNLVQANSGQGWALRSRGRIDDL